MRIKELEFTRDFNGNPRITVTVDKSFGPAVQKLIDGYKPEKAYDLAIKLHREKRSLNANSYFHVLVSKIAEVMNLGDEEEKVRLVLEYGSIMIDQNGKTVGFKLPVGVDINSVYKYAKWFDKRTESGTDFDCYILYEHTHKYNSKQMARLIDGAVYEAKELGIETMTPADLELLKANWQVVK